MMPWELKHKKEILKTHPFIVEELEFIESQSKEPLPHSFFRLHSPAWVNVLPITDEGMAVLIRQPRAGNIKYILETPGGVMDEGEKDPTLTAARELEEETGYSSQRILPLGALNPNPAIMSNKMHMFLALNCRLASQRKHFPDEAERIENVLVPVKELQSLVRRGEIDNCLAALCILMAAKYIDIGAN